MDETYLKNRDFSLANPGESYTEQYGWNNAGSITATQAALSGDLSDATFTALTAAKRIIYAVPRGWSAMALRFRTDGSENNAPVLHQYAQAGSGSGMAGSLSSDHYSRMAQLTLSQGTQLYSTGIYFADSIVEASENWITATNIVMPVTADNHIAQYVFNTHGVVKIGWICSDLGSVTTVYVDVRRI